MILRMLFSLAYSLARFLAELLLIRHRSDAQLRAEVLALRHQFRILEHQACRPRWQPSDRLLLTSHCPITPQSHIDLNGHSVVANGQGPFYFGPYGSALLVGDLNKTPLAVDPGYPGRLMVRGHQLGGGAVVAFGFWPHGFGTPAERPDVPVLVRRADQGGRTVVYEPELDIDIGPGTVGAWRADGHFWSLPARGCYAIQADGDDFSKVTVLSVP